MIDTTDPARYLARLGPHVASYRAHRGLSLRNAALEAGVPHHTLYRTELGQLPGLASFARLIAWTGANPTQFFTPPPDDPPGQVGQLLLADPDLADEYAHRLTDLYGELRQHTIRRRRGLEPQWT